MKNLTENYTDKSKQKIGEWTNEFDKEQFTDEETGYPCLIVRHNTLGHLCGYVGVDSQHPCFQKDYDSVDVNVHGGLTFADKCQDNGHICHKVEEGEDDNVWWLGFDCAHSGDKCPYASYEFDFDTYKNFDYVKSEIKSLAKQLKELQQ